MKISRMNKASPINANFLPKLILLTVESKYNSGFSRIEFLASLACSKHILTNINPNIAAGKRHNINPKSPL